MGTPINKVLVTEKVAEKRFSSNYVSHLKNLLNGFQTDEKIFRFIVRSAINSWKTFDQKALAEFLVFDIFKELDCKS